jgi:hypothetical protein
MRQANYSALTTHQTLDRAPDMPTSTSSPKGVHYDSLNPYDLGTEKKHKFKRFQTSHTIDDRSQTASQRSRKLEVKSQVSKSIVSQKKLNESAKITTGRYSTDLDKRSVTCSFKKFRELNRVTTSNVRKKQIDLYENNVKKMRDSVELRKLVTNCGEYQVPASRSISSNSEIYRSKLAKTKETFKDAVTYKRILEDFPGLENPKDEK